MIKKIANIGICSIILGLLLLFFVPTFTYGKYFSSVDFSWVFSSTTPTKFYFYASADPNAEQMKYTDVLGNVLMLEDEIDLDLIVRNYQGANISNVDISYKIEAVQNDKFDIEHLTASANKDLAKDNKNVNSEKFKLSKKKGVEYLAIETIIIKVTSLSPQSVTLNIPIHIYTQRIEIFDLTYEIQLVDSLDSNEQVVIDRLISTNEDDLHRLLDGSAAISLDSVFGSSRLPNIINFTFYFYVTINANYIADIYYGIDGKEAAISRDIVNEGYPLGKDPIYDDGALSPNLSKGPSKLNLTYTGYENNAKNHYHVIVKVQKVEISPKFDARAWLKTENANGRGSCGTDKGWDGATDKGGNIEPEEKGGYDWSSRGTFYNTRKDMTPDDEYPGTFMFEWTFQTNSSKGGYTLDSFEINGYDITIPFMPGYIDNVEQPANATEDSEKTTVLPDGTIVILKFIRLFNPNSVPQRVYKLTIRNTRSDITVTNGNLMQGTGSSELVVYVLKGIEGNVVEIDDIEIPLSSLYVYANTVSQPGEIKKFKFKVKEFYEKPVFKILDTNGNTLIEIKDFEVESDGTYVIENIKYTGLEKIGLIYVEATPMRFAVKYDLGEIENAELPGLPELYDNNGGEYYTIENCTIIVIHGKAPQDLDMKMDFVCWEVDYQYLNIDTIYDFSYDSILQYAKVNEDGIYVITLTAIWDFKLN